MSVLEAHLVDTDIPLAALGLPILGPYFTVLTEMETRGTFGHIVDRMAELVHLWLHKRINIVHFFTHVLFLLFGLSSR
jgi:hypothetical protein